MLWFLGRDDANDSRAGLPLLMSYMEGEGMSHERPMRHYPTEAAAVLRVWQAEMVSLAPSLQRTPETIVTHLLLLQREIDHSNKTQDA